MIELFRSRRSEDQGDVPVQRAEEASSPLDQHQVRSGSGLGVRGLSFTLWWCNIPISYACSLSPRRGAVVAPGAHLDGYIGEVRDLASGCTLLDHGPHPLVRLRLTRGPSSLGGRRPSGALPFEWSEEGDFERHLVGSRAVQQHAREEESCEGWLSFPSKGEARCLSRWRTQARRRSLEGFAESLGALWKKTANTSGGRDRQRDATGAELHQSPRSPHDPPEEMGLEFGMQLSAEAGAFIASALLKPTSRCLLHGGSLSLSPVSANGGWIEALVGARVQVRR
jgi:hypothetical protein